MPLFDYKCLQCGAVFEVLQAGTLTPDGLRCEACGAERIERLLAVPAAPQIRSCGSSKGAPCGDSPCCGREDRCDRPSCGS